MCIKNHQDVKQVWHNKDLWIQHLGQGVLCNDIEANKGQSFSKSKYVIFHKYELQMSCLRGTVEHRTLISHIKFTEKEMQIQIIPILSNSVLK